MKLIAGIVEQKEVVVIRQWRGKHVSAATNTHATIEEVLETLFSIRSPPLVEEATPFTNTYTVLEWKKNSVMGPETMSDSAGQDQQQFTVLDWLVVVRE
jgi:hypothetical protein